MNLQISNDFIANYKIRNQLNWFVIYTMPHHEKKIHTKLQKEGINSYLPTQVTLKKWSDRKKKVTEPLFSCYLFVQISIKDYYKVLNTPGVIRYICFCGKAVTISDSKIQTIKNLLENKFELEDTQLNFQIGDKVQIIHGSLRGIDGELVMFNNQKRVIIRIEEINKSLFVNIPTNYLQQV